MPKTDSLPIFQRRSRPRRRVLTIVLPFVILLGLALAFYSAITTPRMAQGRGPLQAFDPETVGRLEQRAWAAYYWRQWPQLFDLLLRLTRSQFGVSLPQALYASYLGTQAQIVWARQGERDGLAEDYMRRFYELVRQPAGGRYDPRRAAELEIRWWAVHRQRSGQGDRSALTAALAATYAEVYQAPVERMLPAADARALAMDLSDRWVQEGRAVDSPLLPQIADLLIVSYQALSDAVSS